jgi:hypothetical protein
MEMVSTENESDRQGEARERAQRMFEQVMRLWRFQRDGPRRPASVMFLRNWFCFAAIGRHRLFLGVTGCQEILPKLDSIRV